MAWAVMVAVGLFTACGVPSDEAPRKLALDDVPAELLAPAPTALATTTTVPGTVPAAIFLLRDDRLVPVERKVDSPPALRRVLGALLGGPTDEEAGGGLRSAISAQTALISVLVDGGVARVDLTGSFADIGGQEQILAVAQLVFTATTVEGVSGVQFALDGQPVEVPRADGTLTPGPLGQVHFASLASGRPPVNSIP